MVYLHFPTNLTEEELMLQTKYAKLKKKVSNIPLRNISKNITSKVLDVLLGYFTMPCHLHMLHGVKESMTVNHVLDA